MLFSEVRPAILLIAAASAPLAAMAAEQMPSGPIPPSMHMHRVRAGELNKEGWVRARSTNGAFIVSLPCLYNDYSVGPLTNGPSAATHMFVVGCDRPDHVRFFASRERYMSATVAEERYSDLLSTLPPNVIVGDRVSGSLHDRPMKDITLSQSGKRVWFRLVRAGKDNILLIVEPIGVERPDLRAPVNRFFNSIEIEEAG